VRKMRTLVATIAGLLLASVPAACLQNPLLGREDVISAVSRLTQETQELYDGILARIPYHPSLMAWGMHYLARSCVAMYEVTNETVWMDRAINITDYCVRYSDVNGDGEPSWGAYNETWGGSSLGLAEWTVWDGVISLAIIEVAKTVRYDPRLSSNPDLSAKADAYVELVTKVVLRHRASWTQIGPGQGYYWDDPKEDLGPYVNGFAALGQVELILARLTGDPSFLDRPRQMANYVISSMRYNPVEDLYAWDYKIGGPPAEDISHGSIDLEFLLEANEMGLVDDVHIRRICNAYKKRIWQVPNILNESHPLAMRVDGSGDEDYTTYSRGWIYLSSYEPDIYEQQRIALGIEHERYGLEAAGFEVLAAAEIALFSKRLRSKGIEPGEIGVVSLDQIESLLDQAYLKLNESINLGMEVGRARSMLAQASAYLNEASLVNCSVPIAMIWEVYETLGRMAKAGERLEGLEGQIREAEATVGNISAVWARFLRLKSELAHAETDSAINSINTQIDTLGRVLDTCRSLHNLEVEIQKAGEAGANVSALWPNLSRLKNDAVRAESSAVLDALKSRIDAFSVDSQRICAEALIRFADQVLEQAKRMGIDTTRHGIFLQRAKEEFAKGHYGPAIQFTNYPLTLKAMIPEGGGAALSIVVLLLGLFRGCKAAVERTERGRGSTATGPPRRRGS